MTKKKFDTEAIKQSVNIVDVIEGYGIKLTKAGAHYEGCCPFHDEKTSSFKINTHDQYYYCFGCQATGNAIDFVMEFNGVTFVKACQSLSGAVEGDPIKTVRRVPKEKRVDPYEEYHPKQTSEVISVGQSIDLTNPKRDGKIWKGAKPEMVHEYVDINGEFIGYVLRLNINGHKITPTIKWCEGPQGNGWHYYPFGDNRTAYKIHSALNNDKQVLILEGEKCVDKAGSIIGQKVACIGWSGGTNSVLKTDWNFLSGRNVTLWPDNDEVGVNSILGLASVLQGINCKVRIIRPHSDAPKGWDVADQDWTETELINYLKTHVTDCETIQPEQELPPVEEYQDTNIPNEEVDTKQVEHKNPLDELPFKILGHSRGTRYYLPDTTRQLIELQPAQHSKNNLLSIAPLDWWKNQNWDISTKEGLDNAVNALLQMSSAAGVFNSERLRGRGAWLDEGRTVVHLGESMFVDDVLMRPNQIKSKYIYQEDIDLGIEIVKPATTKEANKLPEICKLLKWENNISSMLLAGWCVIAQISGILPWRPHIWITGPAGVGKSTVMNSIVKPMLANMALHIEGNSSEAGIRQELQQDARPVVYDEADAKGKKAVEALSSVISFSRICSSGGSVTKGTSDGNGIKYVAKAIFCFSSINTSIKDFADQTRISLLVLKHDLTKSEQDFKDIQEKIFDNITPSFASAIFSRSVANMETLLKNSEVFKQAAIIHFKNARIADQIGIQLAGAYLCFSSKVIDREAALEWIQSHDWNDVTTVNASSDEQKLLSTIMTTEVRSDHDRISTIMTIGELILKTRDDNVIYMPALRRVGVLVKDGRIYIANDSTPMKRILRDTEWNSSWARVLKGIEGAETHPNTYFAAGIRSRCVSLPIEVITD